MRITKQDEDRFLQYVAPQDDGCWLWLSTKNQNRSKRLYGRFKVRQKNQLAHRVAYQLWKAELKKSPMTIDHICKNTLCVNPAHLRQITLKENILAGSGLASINAKKTHCKRGHAFTQKNTRIGKRGERICRSCMKQYMRRWRLKKLNGVNAQSSHPAVS